MSARLPQVWAVAGSGSNSGKTTVACALIEALRPSGSVAALKISTATPDHRCARTGEACLCLQFEGRMRILEQDCATANPRKDTGRFLAAGARPVHWLQATSDTVEDACRVAVGQLAAADPAHIVVEGASAIRNGLASHSILVLRAGMPPKPGFASLVPQSHVALLGTGGPPGEASSLRERHFPLWPAERPFFVLDAGNREAVKRLAEGLLAIRCPGGRPP